MSCKLGNRKVIVQEVATTIDNESSFVKNILNTPHNRALLQRSFNWKEPRLELNVVRRASALKEIVLHNLKHHVYARLFKSVYGVGVKAIRKIPAGTSIFDTSMGKCLEYYPVTLSGYDIERLFAGSPEVSESVKSLLGDFFLTVREKEMAYPVNLLGPNSLDVSFFLNHSDDPNVGIRFDDCDMSYYVSSRDIEADEELFIDYRKFDLDENVMKESMPFLKSNTEPMQTAGKKAKGKAVKTAISRP